MVKGNETLSNSQRVLEIEKCIRNKVLKGANDTPAFRKICMSEIGGFTKSEFEKAREVLETGNPDNILVMNLKGLVSGYNRIKPKVRKKVEKKYSLSAESSDIMMFINYKFFPGQRVSETIKQMVEEWGKDFITDYRSYSNFDRERLHNYKNNGDGD